MKIVKRDGRTVEYDSEKIRIAIGKANKEVSDSDRIDNDSIDDIIEYIENLGKKRMLVEDIQDIIEEKLMEKGHFTLAKKYIIYRYTRSIIRQSNTTDASILSLLKGSNTTDSVNLVANRQRDIMAGEVSKDLAYRLLLPQNVVKAEKDNRVKFCNVEYFTEPIIESVKIDLKELFEKGTIINGIKVEEPKSFQSACNVLVEIIAEVATCQTGDIYVELKDLFKYYYLSYEKKYSMYKSLMRTSLTNEQIRAISETQTFVELKSGIQTIFYQTNTMSLSNGLVPKLHFLIDISDITSEIEEKIVYEFIRQKCVGINADESLITQYPQVIYCLDVNDGNYDYLNNELLSSNSSYIVMSKKRFETFKKGICKFNQGSMILNLERLALSVLENNSLSFMKLLDQTLEICYEGFLCRNHNLQGVHSDKSPIHWQNGVIGRLKKSERIDEYLKKEYSYMTLVVIGFENAVKILDENVEFKRMVRDKINGTISLWNEENTFNVMLSNYFDRSVVDSMFKKDALELKKFEVLNIYDSGEFMKFDYFKDGFIYLVTKDNIDAIDSELIGKNIIIKKEVY